MRISDWSSYVCSSDLMPPGVYRISATLRLTFIHDSAAHVGLLSHGATLKSAITDGSPVLEIESQAVVRYLLIEGVQIQGNGSEGHGLLLHADSPSVYLYDICLRDVFIELRSEEHTSELQSLMRISYAV